ncbi:uncharacterized protein VTP21DRAFT_7268 [Calcarisporiella thermophila]|uniref:uncharacterized protein n=1 Tax=Calcarisporiella thermophila TaxID=911321 RepID=UPI003743E679
MLLRRDCSENKEVSLVEIQINTMMDLDEPLGRKGQFRTRRTILTVDPEKTRGDLNQPWKHDLFDASNGKSKVHRTQNVIIKKAISQAMPLTKRIGRAEGLLTRKMRQTLAQTARAEAQNQSGEKQLVAGSIKGSATMLARQRLTGGFSIKGEASGPATIVVSNLESGTSADDIRVVFSQFGRILSCSVVSTHGLRGSFNTAEIEYESRQSAMEAIKKYNNAIADNRVLKVELQSQTSDDSFTDYVPNPRPPSQNVLSQPLSSRPIITTSSRLRNTGKMYSDQLEEQTTRIPPTQSDDTGRSPRVGITGAARSIITRRVGGFRFKDDAGNPSYF